MRRNVTLYVHCLSFNAYVQYVRYQNTIPQIECATSNTLFRDGVRVLVLVILLFIQVTRYSVLYQDHV
jgi:hypothetical protein